MFSDESSTDKTVGHQTRNHPDLIYLEKTRGGRDNIEHDVTSSEDLRFQISLSRANYKEKKIEREDGAFLCKLFVLWHKDLLRH